MGTLAALGLKAGLAVALALAAATGARHLQRLRPGWRPMGRSLHVIETAPLGQNRSLHLVTVGRRTILVGSTQGQIAMLADVTGEQQAPPAETLPRTAGFPAVLSQVMSRRQSPVSDPTARLRAAAEALRFSSAREAAV